MHIFIRTEAIALAQKLQLGLLIDEKRGRAIARKLKVPIIGTAGVLLLAKQKNHIKKIYPLIEELKKAGYFLSESLIIEVLKKAQEIRN